MQRERFRTRADSEPHKFGLKENLFQFSVLAFLTFLVGSEVGIERVALPPLAGREFNVTSLVYTVSFVSAFGAVKAVMNLVAGRWSDRIGRKPLLVAGWAVGLAYPILIIFASSWLEVVVANLALGVNQALAWTMTVTQKIDIAGPKRRGLAVGINEASGYLGVSAGSLAGGVLASSYGLRPAPYLLALGVVVVGGAVSIWPARETLPWARSESRGAGHRPAEPVGQRPPGPGFGRVFASLTLGNRTALAASQAGFINKFADSLVIGFFPLYMLARGMTLSGAGRVAAFYALVWGLLQIPGGWITDRLGRKRPIVVGQFLVGVGILCVVWSGQVWSWYLGGGLMGLGTALVYPNLISVVSDVSDPRWRGNALGAYRFYRDFGYAVGPLAIAAVAEAFGMASAFYFTAAINLASAVILSVYMYETHPPAARAV